MSTPSGKGSAELPSLAYMLYRLWVLPSMAVIYLYERPENGLVRAIARRSGLHPDVVNPLLDMKTLAEFEAAAAADPTPLYYLLLLGALALDSPLGTKVASALTPDAPPDGLPTFLDHLAKFMPWLAASMPDPAAVAGVETDLRALLAQHRDELGRFGPPPTPATLPPTPDLHGAAWLTLEPAQEIQTLFSTALHITISARYAVTHPLGAALFTVPALGTDDQLRELAGRISTPPPRTPLALNGADVLRLYAAMHTLVLLGLADLLPGLMAEVAPADEDAHFSEGPGADQQFVAWTSYLVEQVSGYFDTECGHWPAYQAAQAEVQRLTALL